MIPYVEFCIGAQMTEEGEQLWQYVIKREFSEGAIMMTSFDFPAKALRLQKSTELYNNYG
jgi:hypothetical protein